MDKTCEQLSHKKNKQVFNKHMKQVLHHEASSEYKPKSQGNTTIHTLKDKQYEVLARMWNNWNS